MRRKPRLVLLLLLLSLPAFGAYTLYWRSAAARIGREFSAWAQRERSEKIDLSWHKLHIVGFPTAFRLELTGASLRDAAISPAPVLRVPVLSASARPWNPLVWRLMAQHGLKAETVGTTGHAPIRLAARSATGAVSVALTGGATIWLTFENTTASTPGGGAPGAEGARVAIGLADLCIVLPSRPPRAPAEPLFGIGLRLQQLRLPVAVPPMGDTIDDVSAGLTVKGAAPHGPLIKAISGWRDAGGTLKLDHFRLRWGGFDARGTGTLALDGDLQPVGGFSGAIEGYGEILTALVDSGRMDAQEGGLARLALTLLAKAGPDGRPEIATSFTIENGQMYLGPARLGPAPRIAWE